jgi:pyrroloquinoline quinone (PQQ) biosynthesis protein C
MATETVDRTFVDSLLNEIVYPARDELLAGPFFSDLRYGKLTKRRMQGFSLQHTWFNRALLKGGAIRMLKAVGDGAFTDALLGVDGEVTHPDLCKRFGLSLGLTEDDFRNTIPLPEVVAHVSVIVAGPVIFTSPAVGKAGAMSDETIVQAYSKEMADCLAKPPYSMSPEAIEFFTIHGVVDVDHSAHAADGVARMVRTDHDKQLVRQTVESKVRLKLAKWRALYDRYA